MNTDPQSIAQALTRPIEAWLAQFDAIDLRSAPADFLVGLGVIRKALTPEAPDASNAHAMHLMTALAACEFSLAEEHDWALKNNVEPLQPLSAQWLPILDDGTPEFRLAASLSSLHPLTRADSPITFRAHLEPIQTDLAATPSLVSWAAEHSPDVVWANQPDAQGLQAILQRRLARDLDPLYPHAGRATLHPRLSDIAAFIAADTDEATFSRLAFILSLLDFTEASIPALSDEPHSFTPDPDWARLALCFSRPTLSDGARLPINRDILLLAIRGDRESALEFAAAHLRRHGIPVRRTSPASRAPFDRVVAACLFPLSDESLSFLMRSLHDAPNGLL